MALIDLVTTYSGRRQNTLPEASIGILLNALYKCSTATQSMLTSQHHATQHHLPKLEQTPEITG